MSTFAFTSTYLMHIGAWGLLHFVWQPCLLALSWMACERFLETLSPNARYRTVVVHFCAVMILPVFTLAAAQWAVASATGIPSLKEMSSDFVAPSAPSLLAFSDRFVLIAFPAVALVWLAGFVVMAFHLLKAWLCLRGIPASPASEQMVRMTGDLANYLGQRRTPPVMQADVAVPYVFGVRRPTIVLPVSIERELPSDEIRAILTHELIHIGRSDYALNLLLRMILIVFWFHPAAWLLYFRLCREREMRCDYLAVRHCGSAYALASGLLRFIEKAAPRQPALGLSLTEGPLEARIQALLHPCPAKVGSPRLIFPIIGLLILSATAIWMGKFCLADTTIRGLYVASDFGPIITINAQDDLRVFDLRMKHGQVLNMNIQHNAVPKQRLHQEGNTVTALGDTGEPLLSLEVDPRGRITWDPRPCECRVPTVKPSAAH